MSLELGRVLSDRSILCNRKRQESHLLAGEEVHNRKQRKSAEEPDSKVCRGRGKLEGCFCFT